MVFLQSSQSYFFVIPLFFDFATLFMSQHNKKIGGLMGQDTSHPPSLDPSPKFLQQNACKASFHFQTRNPQTFQEIKCVQSPSKTTNSQPQSQKTLLFVFPCLFADFSRFSMHILPKGKPNHMIQQYQMKKQLVNIDFKKDQGLILKWNYTDLTKRTKYFRHIIVLLTSDQQLAKNAVQDYVRYLKQGDLYTVIYCSGHRVMKIKDWREKTTRAQFSVDAYLSQPLHSSFSFQLAAGLFEPEIEEMSQPTILNFVLQKQEQIINLKNRIVEHQVQLKIKFITSIFSPLRENKLSICSGINTLSMRQPQVFQFYHQYINQMAIQRAHLVITCRNGEISSCNQQEWRNTAFNKVERTYYGPSVRYVKDVLHFTNARIMHVGLYELQVFLEYKCFGGKTYTSEKKMGIHFNHNEVYNRTVCSVFKARVFCPVEEIELEENPYVSETVILFDKIKEGRCKEDI